MRFLAAHWHAGLARLYRLAGIWEEAQSHVATAAEMYRERDMPYWIEQLGDGSLEFGSTAPRR